MRDPVRFQRLTLKVLVSPETNDHQVRFFGDGSDVIQTLRADGMLGLDPDDVLRDPPPLLPGDGATPVPIARCGCGEVGCDSIEVVIRRSGDVVVWEVQQRSLSFPAAQYESELRRATLDKSWETPERTAARLLAERMDKDVLAQRGLTFQWASGRHTEGEFTVSLLLRPGPYQLLVPVHWETGEAPELIAQRAADLLRRDPHAWRAVRYLPQAQGLGRPEVAGAGWVSWDG